MDILIRTDGAGLFCGILKHFINRGSSCPKVLSATHFHEVFREDMLDPDELPATFIHMQIMLTSRKGEISCSASAPSEAGTGGEDDEQSPAPIRPGERLTYLYR